MNRQIACSLLAATAAVAQAGTVCERWGEGSRCTHPDTMKVAKRGKVPRVVFDLSALAPDTSVLRATLRNRRVSQPSEPILIHVVDRLGAQGEPVWSGRPLKLRPPRHASFDLTEAVKRWVRDPKSNHGLALIRAETLDPRQAFLDVCYEGKPKSPPGQVTGLKVVYHDGQTFVTWKELDIFRPPPDKVIWVSKFDRKSAQVETEPGKGWKDLPRFSAIRLGTLRELQMYDVIDPPAGTQAYPKLVRRKDWPDARYRVYRSKRKITPETLAAATVIGEARPLCAYDESMRGISSHGEYYDKREINSSIIPAYCIEDGRSVVSGEAFYMHTPQEEGRFYYAVTTVRNGTENTVDIGPGNSLQKPVSEKQAPFKPILQYASEMKYRGRHYTQYKYYCWPAPPACNLPFQKPLRVTISIPTTFKPGGGLHIGSLPGMPGDNFLNLEVRGRFSHGGQLAYNEGLGTFLSVSESKVDYFAERYMLYVVRWVLKQYRIDRNRVQLSALKVPFALRHPELVKLYRSGPYEVNFDQKWNPASGSLFGRFGQPDVAVTVDGHKAWDIIGTGWYLRQHAARDIPFFVATHGGKESGHAIEFGWQDDPKGWAALRDSRQPWVGAWGGGRVSREVMALLAKWPFDKSMPAFSNCSLDGNPGNGDPADGDPWGQFNGHLLWDHETIVDSPERWEMTVGLAGDAVRPRCTVDVTPRHRRKFNPKPGAKFAWSNTSLADNRVIEKGEVSADKWGLVTLKQITVTKGKNRLAIRRAE